MNSTPQQTLRWTMTWQRRIEQANNGAPDQRYLTIVIHETWTLSWVDEGAVGESSLESQKSISLTIHPLPTSPDYRGGDWCSSPVIGGGWEGVV